MDQYGRHLGRDWSVWGPQAVERADMVVCAASPDYREKWGKTDGSGASEEARTIRSTLAAGKIEILFVVLPTRTPDDIPLQMQGLHWETVNSVDQDGIESVIRQLTDQPLYVRPALGSVPPLPPRS